MRRIAVTLLVLGLLASAATGCGGGGGGSRAVGRSGGGESTHAATPKVTAPPARKATRGRAPRCRPSDLVVFDDGGGNGALSTDYTHFTVGNLSGHACSVSGYPRLYAIGADGMQVGGAARRSVVPGDPHPGPVRIEPEGTATFGASWRADVYDRGVCKPTVVARYRVLLPGAVHARSVPFPVFHRCTNPRADQSLSVGPIEVERQLDGGPRGAPRLPEARPGEHLPRCRPAQLLLYTGFDSPAGVGLGTSYLRIDVANLSSRACEISGSPRAVAVALDGRQVGTPAGLGTQIGAGSGRRLVRIARIGGHGSGAIMVATGSVYNYGRTFCHFRMTAGLRVTLPGSRTGQTVPMLLRRCPGRPASGGAQLSIGRVE